MTVLWICAVIAAEAAALGYAHAKHPEYFHWSGWTQQLRVHEVIVR